MFDVAIVGSGPAGASCAAFCAHAGMRTLLLERENFPREKVCGDCLNPSCWPVLARLGIEECVRASPHGKLSRVDFVPINGQAVSVALPPDAEIAVKRSIFDQLLMARARESGAEVREASTVTALTAPTSGAGGWTIKAGNESVVSRILVAADGRNSTVARLLGLSPRITKERLGLQTHLPLPPNFGDRVVLQFLPHGYSGQAPVGNGELNLCLVSKSTKMPMLRAWAESNFGLSTNHVWRTITPLRRAPLAPAQRGLFLVGDAARVVEPFTGEGIYYALRSGELAAGAITSLLTTGDGDGVARSYTKAHEQLYRGRLWINRISRAAVLSPRFTSALLQSGALSPRLLGLLTAKIVAPIPGSARL